MWRKFVVSEQNNETIDKICELLSQPITSFTNWLIDKIDIQKISQICSLETRGKS